MQRSEALLLESVPLAMAAVCIGFSLDLIGAEPQPPAFTAGHVVLFLASICVALFCTARTIIQQLVGRYRPFERWAWPALGYLAALGTVGAGTAIAAVDANSASFVAGFVIIGIGLVVGCVSTVATASTRFLLIPRNSHSDAEQRSADGFSPVQERALIAVPSVCAGAGLALAVVLLVHGGKDHFVAGHVVLGLSFICLSLVALVATIVRQVANEYRAGERTLWPAIVVAAGASNLIWGVVLLVVVEKPYWITPGWVIIGLGLVCFSILSKVLLLALVWRRTFSLSDRIPLIPVATALGCLFLSAFLFQAGVTDPEVAIPARVLVGLGAVCFTLFSIVSILESGTSE